MAFAYNPPSLRAAFEGGRELRDDMDKLIEGDRTDMIDIIWKLRPLPADDKAKKMELARYFQTPRGQRYTAEEQKQGYDALLGPNRNRRTFG